MMVLKQKANTCSVVARSNCAAPGLQRGTRISAAVTVLLCLAADVPSWAAPDAQGPAGATPAASAATPTGGAVIITIKDFVYSPKAVSVPVGTTITWRNGDAEPHTVRGADASIRSNALDQNDAYSVTFDKPGTYRYGCSIHPQMSGTVIVE